MLVFLWKQTSASPPVTQTACREERHRKAPASPVCGPENQALCTGRPPRSPDSPRCSSGQVRGTSRGEARPQAHRPPAPPPGPPPHFSEFLPQAPLKAVCMPASPSPPSPPQSGLSSESFHRKGRQAPRPGSAAPWRLAPSCTFLISLSLSPRISSTGLCTRAGVPPASVPNWASLKHEIPRRQT